MSIPIQYEVYPDNPKATKTARKKAYDNYIKGIFFVFGSIISSIGSIASIIAFIYYTVQIFKTGFSLNLLYSLAFFIGLAIIDYFCLFKYVGIIDSFLKYLLFVVCGTVVIISCVVVIMSIATNKLIWCLIAVLFLIIIVTSYLAIFIKKLAKSGKKLSLFTSRDTKEMIEHVIEHTTSFNKDIEYVTEREKEDKANFINEDKIDCSLYCHKCGKKVPIDSAFCYSCGAGLKRE